MRIRYDGNVGIGTNSPSYMLHVNGSVAGATWDYTSDDRIKHNEKNITNALDTINKLRVKQYFKTNEVYDASHNFELDNSGNPITEDKLYEEVGLIAQQIRKIPELAFCVSGKEEEEETITHYKKDSSGNYITDISGDRIFDFNEKTIVKRPLHLKYNDIFCYSLQAIQELSKRIQQIEQHLGLN